MKHGPENKETAATAVFLEKFSKKNKSSLWLVVAQRITAPTRSRAEMNVGKLSAVTQPNDVVVIPGKVLGSGSLAHAIQVGALAFAASASEKIKKAGGKTLSLRDLAKAHPKGSKVRLLC